MKSVIHQPFGDILNLDPRGSFERPEIEDELVGDPASRTPVKNWVVVGEAFREVVGIEDGDLGATGESLASHHSEDHPRNDQNAGTAVRSGGDGSNLIFF